MPLIEILAAGAAAAEALSAIFPQLNGARSVVIEVDNKSFWIFNRIRDNHEHGGVRGDTEFEHPAEPRGRVRRPEQRRQCCYGDGGQCHLRHWSGGVHHCLE